MARAALVAWRACRRSERACAATACSAARLAASPAACCCRSAKAMRACVARFSAWMRAAARLGIATVSSSRTCFSSYGARAVAHGRCSFLPAAVLSHPARGPQGCVARSSDGSDGIGHASTAASCLLRSRLSSALASSTCCASAASSLRLASMNSEVYDALDCARARLEKEDCTLDGEAGEARPAPARGCAPVARACAGGAERGGGLGRRSIDSCGCRRLFVVVSRHASVTSRDRASAGKNPKGVGTGDGVNSVNAQW
mmetsp:Transcript_40847/g.123679  ORF Transcript_40847/g.123679 Transcript_40847/m.123679 type:complete len:258 (-) Transcript_40847:541-1314(-)